MKVLSIYRGTSGLNDKFDGTRVPYDPETGVLGLTIAENIVIDLSGAVSRRDGYERKTSGKCSSIFSCGDYGLCIIDAKLYLINADLSLVYLVDVRSPSLAYARYFDGVDDTVFFIGQADRGKVVNKAYSLWTVPSYVGPETTESKVMQYLSNIPSGHMLSIHNGHMYLASGNIIFVSEPFAFSWFNPIKAYVFDSRITMLNGLKSGIYVSTLDKVLFLTGTSPENFSIAQVFNHGAIEGSAQVFDDTNTLVFACSGIGLCAATIEGIVTSITETYINFPKAVTGSSLLYNTEYLLTLHV